MIKICLQCNGEFKTRRSKQKFCNQSCSFKNGKINRVYSTWTGKKQPREMRIKKSLSMINFYKKNPEARTNQSNIALSKGFGKWMKGRKLPLEQRRKMSESRKGIKHWAWKKDRSLIKSRHDDVLYYEWRMNVYKRDSYKCKINNKDCKGKIAAHHILRWADYLELRYEINNGITLCNFHHPRKKKEEIRLSPYFKKLLKVV